MPENIRTGMPEQSDINIIDVLGFLWRSKFFLISGMILGLAVARIVEVLWKPPIYVTQVPVVLIFSLEDQNTILAKLNEFVTNPETARQVYQRLLSYPDPEVRAKLTAESIDVTSFINKQRAQDEKLSFRIAKGSRLAAFELETRFAFRDSKAAIATAIAEIVRDLSLQHNKEILRISPEIKEEKQAGFSETQRKYQELNKLKFSDEKESRLRLYRIEARLLEKLGPDFSSLLRVSGGGDQILRLLAMLLESKKITERESETILQEREELVVKLELIRIKYEQVLIGVESDLRLLGKESFQSPKASDNEIPILSLDQNILNQRLSDVSYVRVDSKTSQLLTFGMLFGALVGVLINSGNVFLRENKQKLKAAFR